MCIIEIASSIRAGRFQGIYESSKDAIAYATLEGRYQDVNESMVKLTGYSREDLLKKTYQELTADEYRHGEVSIVHAVLSTGQPAESNKRLFAERVSVFRWL